MICIYIYIYILIIYARVQAPVNVRSDTHQAKSKSD